MSSVITQEFATLVRRRYPPFVYDSIRTRPSSARLEYLPIFAFHSLDPSDLESKLKYLVENRYRTVTLDEVVNWMSGDRLLPPNAIALTIDDGRLSTWTVAYPLLKRYGMTATAFVMPGYVPGSSPRPTLEDVWSGDVPIETITANEDDDRCALASWEEIRRMHESGIVQIESHTMLHRRVFVAADEPVGFITPATTKHLYDTPLAHGCYEPWSVERVMDRLGMPLYRHVPLLSVEQEVVFPERHGEEAVRMVRENGGAAFFEQRGWKRKLRSVVHKGNAAAARLTSTIPTQRWELQQSKRVLEERLPGKVVKHLCFPHGIGSDGAKALCAETGYQSGIWNVLDARRTNRPGCCAFAIGRLKHDFIYRLPGDSRRSLVRILGEKVTRRLSGRTGY